MSRAAAMLLVAVIGTQGLAACASRTSAARGPNGGLKGDPTGITSGISAGVSAVARAGANVDWQTPYKGAKKVRRVLGEAIDRPDLIDGKHVEGVVVGTNESFSGFVASSLWGGGRMEIVTSSGLKCAGEYSFARDDFAEGMLRCSNGGTGPFTFVTTRGGGSAGTGTFGSRYFKFTIG